MRDDRWIEVENDFGLAAKHFTEAARLFERGHSSEAETDGYLLQMGFMHAMQAGHSSMESGFLRILAIVGEVPPAGESWHADLIKRLAIPLPGKRPALLTADLVKHADETRKFRHVAMKTYDDFDWLAAKRPVASGKALAAGISAALLAFKAILDPPGSTPG